MTLAHAIKAVFPGVCIATPALLGHPLLALLALGLLGAKALVSLIWELHGAALVGDIARVAIRRVRRTLRLPPIEESPSQRQLDERKR